MSLTLYSFPNNFRVWAAQVVAQVNGLDLNLSEDYKGKSALNKAPVLETTQGNLFESNAINRYLARLNPTTNLMGNSFFEQALVDQWVDFCTHELEVARNMWVLPVQGTIEFNGRAYGECKKDVSAALRVLNAHLESNQFLVGHQVTLADITMVACLVDCYRLVFATGYRKQFGNVNRWFNCCVNQPEFAAVLGKVEFCTKEKQAPKPKKKEQPKKQQKKAKAAPQPAAPKKEKFVDPITLLPPSSMNMDAEKKQLFSKRPINLDFFDDFWARFDAEGYSIWQADYNYNAENLVFWKIQNQMQGWIQRLERSHKHALGVLCLTGKDEDTGPFPIETLWVFRGLEIPFTVKDSGDAEYYTFTKLDHKNADHQAKFKEYFYSDAIKGGKVLDRRYFK